MVDTIFQFGEDALNNEASISIDVSSLGSSALKDIVGQDELKFRAVEFNIPQKTIRTYSQSYKGFEIERWKAGVEMTRELTITYRVDKYWNVYRFHRAWMELISDLEGDGSYYPDVADNSILRTTATIQQLANTLDSNGNASETIIGNGWIFSGIWPKSMPEVTFNTTSEGDQVELQITYGFLNYRMGDDA